MESAKTCQSLSIFFEILPIGEVKTARSISSLWKIFFTLERKRVIIEIEFLIFCETESKEL